jgi:hypothetical protein
MVAPMTDVSIGALERYVNGRLNGRIAEFHLAAEAQGLVLRGKLDRITSNRSLSTWSWKPLRPRFWPMTSR